MQTLHNSNLKNGVDYHTNSHFLGTLFFTCHLTRTQPMKAMLAVVSASSSRLLAENSATVSVRMSQLAKGPRQTVRKALCTVGSPLLFSPNINFLSRNSHRIVVMNPKYRNTRGEVGLYIRKGLL